MDVLKTELLTLEEIATALRLNIETPRRWCRSGKLASVKVGKSYRVTRPAFDDFIAAHSGGTGKPPGIKKAVSTSQRRRPQK